MKTSTALKYQPFEEELATPESLARIDEHRKNEFDNESNKTKSEGNNVEVIDLYQFKDDQRQKKPDRVTKLLHENVEIKGCFSKVELQKMFPNCTGAIVVIRRRNGKLVSYC